MDIITKSHFEDFKQQYGYHSLTESDIFELFCIYCIASKYIKQESITKEMLDDIKIGNGGDWGIDGLFVVVNGQVVFTEDAVDDLLKANGFLAVQIVAIQAKTSSSFNVAELGQTLDGAQNILNDILGDTLLPKCNEDLVNYRSLIKHIYENCAHFKDGVNPQFNVYYVTCGVYNAQEDFLAKIASAKEHILLTDLVNSFECKLLGSKELVNLYKETKTKINVTLKVNQKLSLPEVENVEDSYLCLLSFQELCKLFMNEDGNLVSEVFYDNIRAFQGENIVNRKMKESICTGNIDLFAAMNNGITVICKNLRATGLSMILSDFQIVNGCQTCNILYQCKEVPGIDRLKVSVKIIVSSNKEIRDKIIIANNSQTEVKQEQLISLLETQQQIEDYYNAQNSYEKLYYERRSKQYKNGITQVPAFKVVTIPNQIQSFVSMMMGKPDKVRGYYGSIVDEFDKAGRKIFAIDTKPDLYYTSALTSYKMGEFFNNGIIPRKYKKVKFHILLAFRLMCEKFPIPQFNSNKVQDYCEHLCKILCNDEDCKNGFTAALRLIDIVLRREPEDRDRLDSNFTKKMYELAAKLNTINKGQQ